MHEVPRVEPAAEDVARDAGCGDAVDGVGAADELDGEGGGVRGLEGEAGFRRGGGGDEALELGFVSCCCSGGGEVEEVFVEGFQCVGVARLDGWLSLC